MTVQTIVDGLEHSFCKGFHGVVEILQQNIALFLRLLAFPLQFAPKIFCFGRYHAVRVMLNVDLLNQLAVLVVEFSDGV